MQKYFYISNLVLSLIKIKHHDKMAKILNKAELSERLEAMEQELHEANNSKEYWSYEYHNLLKSFEALKTSADPIQLFLSSCNIIDRAKVEDFIKNL